MRAITALLSLALLWTIPMRPSAAAEVYRWVDTAGIVHYSDEKPRDNDVFTTFEIETTRPRDYDPMTDPYSIENQAKRINESWSALSQARDARIEQRRRAAQDTQPAEPGADQQRLEYGTRYLNPWFYSPRVSLNNQYRVDPHAAQRQLQAIEGLELAGRRPASINSGVHRARVQRSEALPVTGTTARRQR